MAIVRRHDKRLTVIFTVFICISAVMFILPTILTIANSFMTNSEISANYGAMISNMSEDKKTFISENVNLKFIPDEVTLSQYKSVLIMNSDYLMKFWNSVISVRPPFSR